jgi:hypothetical protein
VPAARAKRRKFRGKPNGHPQHELITMEQADAFVSGFDYVAE